jgi:hypothetical protein
MSEIRRPLLKVEIDREVEEIRKEWQNFFDLAVMNGEQLFIVH